MQPQYDVRYLDLLRALIRARRRLGIPQTILDARVGWPDGYAGKVEVGMRSPRLATACEWAQALGYRLIIRPAPGKQSGPRDGGPVQLSLVPLLERAIRHPST